MTDKSRPGKSGKFLRLAAEKRSALIFIALWVLLLPIGAYFTWQAILGPVIWGKALTLTLLAVYLYLFSIGIIGDYIRLDHQYKLQLKLESIM